MKSRVRRFRVRCWRFDPGFPRWPSSLWSSWEIMATHIYVEEYSFRREILGREARGSIRHWDVDAISRQTACAETARYRRRQSWRQNRSIANVSANVALQRDRGMLMQTMKFHRRPRRRWQTTFRRLHQSRDPARSACRCRYDWHSFPGHDLPHHDKSLCLLEAHAGD